MFSWLACRRSRVQIPVPKFGAQTPPYPTSRSQRCVKGPKGMVYSKAEHPGWQKKFLCSIILSKTYNNHITPLKKTSNHSFALGACKFVRTFCWWHAPLICTHGQGGDGGDALKTQFPSLRQNLTHPPPIGKNWNFLRLPPPCSIKKQEKWLVFLLFLFLEEFFI